MASETNDEELAHLVRRFIGAVEELSESVRTAGKHFEEFNACMQKLMAITATERATGQFFTGLLNLFRDKAGRRG